MSRLLDALLTTDPVQRVRLSQSGLALLLMAAGVAAMHYFAVAGVATVGPVLIWSAFTLGGMLVFFALIRSGASRRWAEPSLTVPQMLFALTSSAVAYTLLGAGRGAVFPVVMVVLMFGMFVVSPRQMRWLSVYAVLLFGSAMAFMTLMQPRQYPLVIEVGHFLLVATMLPAVSLLAGRLSRIRHRARQQRAELAQALARLRETATRDELTGLINKRHMLGLMAQEHQRCIRSGQSFCLALLDVDRFKPVNEAHGYAVGDAVLAAIAQEAQRQVRVSDMLARWGGEEFLLMMSDTHAALARGGLERLQQRLAALRILHGTATVGVTLSAGLAEHIAGEPLERTLERTVAALAEAKAQGTGRVVIAP
ncbi:MAG: diguanylate cyclase [Betaproteobacteria bacterium]|jgi:diguanylate cyclase (GGDEF)-like protein